MPQRACGVLSSNKDFTPHTDWRQPFRKTRQLFCFLHVVSGPTLFVFPFNVHQIGQGSGMLVRRVLECANHHTASTCKTCIRLSKHAHVRKDPAPSSPSLRHCGANSRSDMRCWTQQGATCAHPVESRETLLLRERQKKTTRLAERQMVQKPRDIPEKKDNDRNRLEWRVRWSGVSC